MFLGVVGKRLWITDVSIATSLQLNLDIHLPLNVRVAVGWSLEHNCKLQ